MPTERKKIARNRYARSAKMSEYKTLQLVECFARDLSVSAAARLTRFSERTVRDRYAELRSKLLPWAIAHPDRFNSFGHLLLDMDGGINPVMMEVMLWYGRSAPFRARMAQRYPRWNPDTMPVLEHVVEHAIRRFCAIEPPETGEDFKAMVRQVFAAAQIETTLRMHKRRLSQERQRSAFWRAVDRRLHEEAKGRIRRIPIAQGERFFRDLRAMLRERSG